MPRALLFSPMLPPPPRPTPLSLHDALPISSPRKLALRSGETVVREREAAAAPDGLQRQHRTQDRKSTRLNSSHTVISYAVFCLKKKTAGRHRQLHPDGGTEPIGRRILEIPA